VDIYYQTKFR